MSDLTDFLLARLGADEQTIRTAWHDDDIAVAPFTVTRLLAEVDAKRAIVKVADDKLGGSNWSDAIDYAMREMAAVYAEHPDYREEWAL